MNTRRFVFAACLVPAKHLALAALLLSASHSLPCAAAAATPATKTSAEAESERQASVARRLENALARKLLRQAAELLPYVQQTGLGNIQRKLEQFDQAVDEAMLTGEVRRQGELLTHLVKTHEVSRDFSAGDASFAQLVSQLASVLVSLPDMRDELKEEATRLDAAISANASAAGSTKTTAAKTFPNTYEGRQAYLDQLQGALFKGQMQWYDILTHYDESDLAVTGTESADTPFAFRYLPDEGALLVNLSDMGRLPAFELGGLAIIYGFPGVHTLYGRVPADGLQRQMQLPGVSLGWGAYLLARLASQDEEHPRHHLRLQRLLASLAQADIGVHEDGWNQTDTHAFLVSANPDYPAARLELMAQEVAARPGTYAAMFAGKLRFQELLARCEAQPDCTDAKYHQAVMQAGPLTFRLLEWVVHTRLLDGE